MGQDLLEQLTVIFISLKILGNNQLHVWGNNDYGQLGVGDTEQRVIPEVAINDITAVASGINHTLALSKKGHVYSTGCNKNGELGISKVLNNFYSSKYVKFFNCFQKSTYISRNCENKSWSTFNGS